MASRTKSFFDQDHTSKPRPPQWHKPNATRVPLSEGNPNIAPARPAISPTPRAKTKLKAFQFIEGHPEETESVPGEVAKGSHASAAVDQGARMGGTASNAVEGASSTPHLATTIAQPGARASGKAPELPHANTFPSTPGARLPLEDLIGNLDENPTAELPKEQSCEEQIGWIPNSSSSLLTPNRKRKRRARSSSPSCPNTSSQQASTFFAQIGTQSEKKTPEADPTASLWKSYGAGKGLAEGLRVPEVNLFQASPRPLETPAKSAAFRRWASTGNDWPSSKNKRRRTDTKANIALWQDHMPSDSAGKSKIAGMIERLQESLASQKVAQSTKRNVTRAEGPSSSSPLPETGVESFGEGSNTSPLQDRRQQRAPMSPPKLAAPPVQFPKPARVPLETHRDGMHTIDDDVRHVLPQPSDVVKPATLHLQTKAPLPAYRRLAMARTSSGSGRQYPTKQPSPAPVAVAPPTKDDMDEFGDEFDLSAEDLEELVSQKPLDHRALHEIPAHPNPPPSRHDSVQTLNSRPNTTTAFNPRPAIAIDDDDDEFGGDDLDENMLAEAEISATQAFRIIPRTKSPRKARSPRKTKPQACRQDLVVPNNGHMSHRYAVKQVIMGEYTNGRGRVCVEKLLMAENEGKVGMAAITLRDSWAHTSVAPGNVVHVARLRKYASSSQAPPSTPAGQIYITDDDTSSLLIVHPDHMLSATTVADSFDCLRKAVLQDRIKATGETAKPMVYGKILHEIFQQALSANQWDAVFLTALVERTVQCHVEGLWELGMKDTILAIEEITAKMTEMAAWAQVFIAATPSSNATVDDRQGEKVWMSISKLIAIEEHIWSPRYGLKGNIDATIQGALIDHPKEAAKKLIAPFEVKTGRTTQSPAHRAQTALYTLLLSDRYDVSVEAGILYYLESSTMTRIAPPLNEIRQMVQQRNRLAAYIHRARHPQTSVEAEETSAKPVTQTQEIEESGLPGLLKNPFKCGRCYAQQSCFTYHALVENGAADSAGMKDDGKKNHSMVWQEAVGHLARSVKDRSEGDQLKHWFAKWDRLLTFEESQMSRYRKELWTMSSAEREAAGRCFGDLILGRDLTSTASTVTQATVDGIEDGGGKINRYAYVFCRAESKAGTSFAEGTQLTVGEPVVVSSESGQWALANGYVIAASKHDVTVAVDRKLGDARQRLDGFDEARNHAFRGTMTVGDEEPASGVPNGPTLYRLDKDEFSNGLALVRNNLVTLMSTHPIHAKLRNQVVFSTAPAFSPPSQLPALPPSQLGDMNDDQRAAVHKVLNAQDYALILGMPGTGKTTTIAHIIRALLADNQTILLTSFTHTAVDNILLKIRDIAPPNSILRLGVPAKINPEVQKFCRLAATPRKAIDEIEEAYMGCRIVATTCMGTNHALFNRRAFDVCIVDEASQITLPTSLGPLLHTRKFVLVGDHYQLPPLVQNKAALEGGLDISLFRQLSEGHPEAVATLGKQYRMCEEVMSLSNTLIYDGKLHCGSEAVAKRTLTLANPSALLSLHTGSNTLCPHPCWLQTVTDPTRKVVFANTTPLGPGALETLTTGGKITNDLEARLTTHLVTALLAQGVPGKDIGIITLYRSQLALLRQFPSIPRDVEIDSADRFQGRDKEVIILSMVRANEQGIVGELLKDWRRVNVALTRARSKLIVLGHGRTLGCNTLLAKFLALVKERKWGVDLPRGAEERHGLGEVVVGSSEVVSPLKRKSVSPVKMGSSLGVSASAWNRSPVKRGSQGPKVVKGSRAAVGGTMKARMRKEQMAVEIFEDLTADDF